MSCLIALLMTVNAAGAGATLSTDTFTATFERGEMMSLTDASGFVYCAGTGDAAATAHHLEGDGTPGASALSEEAGVFTETMSEFQPVVAEFVESRYRRAGDEIIVSQRAQAAEPGLWGVSWSITGIPLDMAILAPGFSGMRLTRDTPGTQFVFDYPMMWEAQLVVVEGAGRGCYVWAEDARGTFKRLAVHKCPEGWRLTFTAMAYAPFDAVTACESPPWRVGVYAGDWRVPARRYRDWAEQAFGPTPIAQQQPEWVKDIRCSVILGLDLAMLEALPGRLDPSQTMLYIPSWRKAGYDRNYPDYEAVEQLAPFIERAHALGYRVMLHVNYFGCDPLHPLYAQFEPYHVRSAWGNHDKQWWNWTRAEPPIKFAYINPAHKPWRDLFVDRMKTLCNTYNVDSLHLDQTLCIENDHNGLLDGVSMSEGNILLHRELREALPRVALSGEGLNEITYAYEAFAQRHASGINHADGLYNDRMLATAHPISSYLFRPYTIICGYLGYAPPTHSQLYAAWNDAYEHWGVIPTLIPRRDQLEHPSEFTRQFFDEAAFWLEHRLEPDMDGAWPSSVAFPFKTATGDEVVRTVDHRLLWGEREISRTLFGVSEVSGPGNVPGWRAYTSEKLLGLDPALRYPYFTTPRRLDALHVTALPPEFSVSAFAQHEELALIAFAPSHAATVFLAEEVGAALCGARLDSGARTQAQGDYQGADGGQFVSAGRNINAHPPYKTGGSGAVFAQWTLELPADAVRLVTKVALEHGAVGESDGVTFAMTASAENETAKDEIHCAQAEPVPMTVDLRPFAGRRTLIELTAHCGPAGNPSYDWARWHEPRIERAVTAEGAVTLAGVSGWTLGISAAGIFAPEDGQAEILAPVSLPGSVLLLKETPTAIALPADLRALPRVVTVLNAVGAQTTGSPHAAVEAIDAAVGGEVKPSLFAHPPDHGRTRVDFPMLLPNQSAVFRAHAGIRDGGKSQGVIFIVEANGREIARYALKPGAWQPIECVLADWAGRPFVLTLITDADGSYVCDWAVWGEPAIVAGPGPSSGQPAL
jgi:hypothetical protein